ncbi:major facilitator superfamily domain-containing protein [Diplogelasinospora grovesii]|uniref:Major facilitator superfamily domain-containing protein n=1 Tax=Diplogelasinospora grovesii TaxID=303347 RepID=A0AAN6N9X9_9PEZI|nr:major facilitator superfamily domain-containing protein [Diplogelasinospora grovesii]
MCVCAPKVKQLISSTLNIGTILGVLLTGLFGRYFGRRPVIWVAAGITFAGSSVQIAATNVFGAVCVGRVLMGISNAFLFLATPAHLRAVVASLFGCLINKRLNMRVNWAYRIPLAALFVIPAVLGVLVICIPESPRWLLVKDRAGEAERAPKRLRRGEEEFTEMVGGIEEEKALAESAAFWDMFRGSDFSGLWLFIAYATFFFQMAGINDSFTTSTYFTLASLLGAVVGMWLVYKHMGRRAMMLSGTACAGLCMFAAALADTLRPGSAESGEAIAGFSIIFGCLYNGFAGTLSWPLSSEIPSSRLRVLTVSLATGISYFFRVRLISFCTPCFINSKALNWGGRCCWIWAASNAIKGRPLEEIGELFQNRVSVRDFPKYECISSTRAHELAIHQIKGDRDVQVEKVEKAA